MFGGDYRNFELNGVTVNQFERDIEKEIEEVKQTAINENSMQNLASGIDKLFLEEPIRDDDLWTAIKLWNANAKKVVEIPDERQAKQKYSSQINTPINQNNIYTYYEYMQFKRARFNCEKTEYNPKTGRIIKMKFEFNGKIE